MLLTVKGDKEDKIRGLQAGADDYLTKPFNSEELRVRIRVGQRIVRLQRQRIEFETRFYVRQLEEMVEELL
jgi:DNA-binding response OmpR family regulator